MSEQEKYIADQKNCGIEVGDTVRVTRPNTLREGGSDTFSHTAIQIKDGHCDGVVHHIEDRCIWVADDEGEYAWQFPYFVLEIVKKADGNVPDAKPITKGDSNMKNSRFDIEIVKEKTDDKGKATNGIVVKRYTKWHVDAVAATAYATKKHGLAILEQEEAGFEVDILVHPFCG